ncbi:CinA family protein [Bifidobacterium sp. ESL0690]|uniref:CinA family protein n=1 Tax=Bifidobacterium sp. ESL0690 TaxID=2983214 RepID=UPI0023F7C168|nr:CinA family protein [Bifidobacterium sp. ESL0690]WEV47767.1 CinA family protein [Bifidobacterium sp. ESL0690]
MQPRCDELAAHILDGAKARGWKIAAAESLTGGLLADAFVRIPGASDVFLGSAVTYDINAKASVLGVDADLLEHEGAVHPEVARQMALRTSRLYRQPQYGDKVLGLSTTGVAGPGPDGDKPAGLVYIGISVPANSNTDIRRTAAAKLRLSGSREEVRRLSVLNVLQLVTQLTTLTEE